MKLHPSITVHRVCDAVERRMTSLDNPGFCLTCGEEAEGCEPDARRYKCEHCGDRAVYGADELLIRMMP
jgi:hypothetical protein